MVVVGLMMNNFILFVLLLSHARVGTTSATCSWGTWSTWNCTCCGNSEDQPVYRVRTQCCPGTYACGNLRIMVEKITFIGTDFKGKGLCSKDCSRTDFSSSNRCSSVVPTMNQTLLLAEPALCRSVCIGSLTTTVSSLSSRSLPPKTTVTHRTASHPFSSQPSKTTVTHRTASHPFSSLPPKTTVTHRTASHPFSSLPPKTTVTHRTASHPFSSQPSKTIATYRTSPRVDAVGVKSSTYVPSHSSHDTVQTKDRTKRPNSGSNRSPAVSYRLILWILVVFTTALCLLGLKPTPLHFDFIY